MIEKINEEIWNNKYRRSGEAAPEQTFRRVAKAAANGDEALEKELYEEFCALRHFPGGRIIASAGSGSERATLSNCFVLPAVPDSMVGILDNLKAGALTMQAGGGIGMNFSKIRPADSLVKGTGAKASGPVSFMLMWNSMSVQISGVNDRKGAMMAVLNVDHPDIFKFISAKEKNCKETPVLEKFNISVGITDAFIQAVKADGPWDLVHNGKVYETVRARDIMDAIVEQAHKKAEPGVIFLDRVNKGGNLYPIEEIDACNPCGEEPLAAYDSCNLWSMNLAQFVDKPFTSSASFDFAKFEKSVRMAIRGLDNVLDINYYPLPEQKKAVEDKRKVGLGIMGLGSALAMLTLRYGSKDAVAMTEKIMKALRDHAVEASVALAKERGAFPLFDADQYLAQPFLMDLDEELRASIREYGIRNSYLLTIAPTGSLAQLAGVVSGGVEPIFKPEFIRNNWGSDVAQRDYAAGEYRRLFGDDGPLPDYFVSADELTVEEHLETMAVAQKYVDAAISKTINLPRDITISEMEDVYLKAYDMGLKGCTVFRTGSLDGVLKAAEEPASAPETTMITEEKKERPYRLSGETLKTRIPGWKHPFYLSFTDYEESGSKKPAEVFINTNDPLYSEFAQVIGKLASEIMRRADNPAFVADILCHIESKETGFFSSLRRKWVGSLTAEFGECMKDHFRQIGLLEEEVPIHVYAEETNGHSEKPAVVKSGEMFGKDSGLGYCRKCGKYAMLFQEGCPRCLSCGDSKCG